MLTTEKAGVAPKGDIKPDNYRFLQDYIYKQSGIVIDDDKQYLLEARLLPVARQREVTSLNDLCALLRATSHGSELQKQVVEAMTTHETLFFRDPQQYDALKKEILPPLIKQRAATRQLSFWSAASSSGQEAYSLAIMLAEMGLTDWRIKILGTDLSDQILDRARKATYMQLEVNRGMPAPLLVKYFHRHGLEWQLKDDVRRMVTFQRFDLRGTMRTLGPFDVVFCRNVLIYFDNDTKKKILTEIRSTLHTNGHLLLGGAESPAGLVECFERVRVGQTTLFRAC